jgi:DNA-binding SARP family transcriptional activator/tetratricopeptide (TPR) repeat protein/DNA-binding XRE family transcriptional regulator
MRGMCDEAQDPRSAGLGALVARYRRRAGLTQQQAADRARISLGALRDIEQGRVTRPRSDALARLAAALQLRPAELAEFAGPSNGDRRTGPELRLGVLGRLVLRIDGAAVDLGSVRQRALLGLLAMSAGAPVSSDELVDAVWGAHPPATASQLIQNRVSRLRRRLEPACPSGRTTWALVATSGGYQLMVGEDQLDLLTFRALVADARRARDHGDLPTALAAFRAAADLWRGEPLVDIAPLRSHPAVAALQHEWRTTIVEFASTAGAVGQHEAVLPLLRQVVDADTLHEPAHAQLMLALASTGQPAAAVEVYGRLRRRLADELGVDPAPEPQRLHRKILRGELSGAVVTGQRDHQLARLDVPAQLPVALCGFVGRGPELAELDSIVSTAGEQPASMRIAVLSGTAGVGKTTLAVHWAHLVRDRFPDGQLYVNLRGFDPAGDAMRPSDVVRGFLHALAVPADRIPKDTHAQAALYRSLLVGRRILVVLDNAADVDQVRPLLPGSPNCMVLVTSRTELTGLVVAEGARSITVNLFSLAESRELLSRRIGPDRAGAAPRAVDELVDVCARLPLAMAVVAARAAVHPGLSLDTLAAELRETGGSLDVFDSGDTATDLRNVFAVSYRAVGVDAGRLFRLLGLHPAPEVGLACAASLAGVPVRRARALLTELARANLVAEHRPNRYALHDLLHRYAVELATGPEGESERGPALGRMFDHYLHAAYAADRTMYPQRDRIALAPANSGVVVDDLVCPEEALGWYTTERPALLAVLARAAGTGCDTHAWQLAWALMNFFDRQGHWHDWAATHLVALEAARRLADPTAQAHIHRGLGRAYVWLGRHEDARRHLEQAVELFGRVGDHEGQARAQLALGWAQTQRGWHRDAIAPLLAALRTYETVDHRSGQSSALNMIGWEYTKLGDHGQALVHCQRALALQRDLGDHRGEAHTLDSLGLIHHNLGRHADAVACYRQALDSFRVRGERYHEAETLSRLGDAHLAACQPASARVAWEHAASILADLGLADVEQVHTKLGSLPG